MTAAHRPGPSKRTRLVTFASIAVVVIAGAAAIGANIGILNAASDTKVGSLSAAGDLTTTTPSIAAAATAIASVSNATTKTYTVDVAGTVSLGLGGSVLTIDNVLPAAGWTWTVAQTEPNRLTVTFTDKARTLDFVATRGADGTVVADVTEPVSTNASVAPPSNSGSGDDTGTGQEYEGGSDDD